MPRIPQGEFQSVPSQRVGNADVRQMPDAGDQVVQQMSNLAGVMAQLQDQTERTDAYQYANQVKSRHLQRKNQFAAALESVNGSGMTDYFDPTDQNPDVAKRKRIQRPIQEMYKEMVDEYESEKQGATSLTRGDIAGDLLKQYVEDDLVETSILTNKHLNKVRTKETTDKVQENMELHFNNFINQAIQPDASPQMLQLQTSRMKNAISREIGTVGNIIGRDGVQNFQKYYDRAAATAANQIISAGVTGTTVAAADELVKGIRDPGQRQAAMMRLENTKKATATVKNMTLLNSNRDVIAHVMSAPAIDDVTYVKGMENVKNTLNMFTDPKYSAIGDEQKNASANELASTLLSKRILQQNIGTDMTYLMVNPASRNPGSAGGIQAAEEQLNTLRASIDQELEASGIKGMMGNNPTLAESVREMTIQKLRAQQASVGDNIPDIIKATKPGITGRAFIEEVQHAANAQGAGDVPLVGKKDRVAFKANFEQALAKDPGEAMNLFNQHLIQAGTAYEGENSYRRRMAIDIVDKNPKMAFLIPAADADQATQYEMMQNAARYQTLLKEIPEVSDGTFQEAFVGTELRTGLTALRNSSPTMYEGIKQAIFHEAANHVSGKSDVKGAVEKAAEKMKSLYTTMPVIDGTSSILALNRGGGINYADKKTELKVGAEKAIQLPFLSREEKIDIMERYGKGNVLDRNAKDNRVTTPDHAIDFHLKNLVTIEPDSKYPNMHVLKIGAAPISKKDGTRIKISAEQIYGYGKAYREASIKAAQQTGPAFNFNPTFFNVATEGL